MFHSVDSSKKLAKTSTVTVIDGKGHLLGRLCSIVAKQLLTGKKIIVVRAEQSVIRLPAEKQDQVRPVREEEDEHQPRKRPLPLPLARSHLLENRPRHDPPQDQARPARSC